MKCIKCRSNNIVDANYCKKCGYHFSKEEQLMAKSKTLVGKLEILEETYGWVTLKKITGHIVVKILALLLVVLLGIVFWLDTGSNLKILESDEYVIQYNTELEEYYLLVNEDKVRMDLYIPNTVEDLVIKEFDENDNLVESYQYEQDSEVILNANGEEYYYILDANYGKKKENMKIYVYRMGS